MQRQLTAVPPPPRSGRTLYVDPVFGSAAGVRERDDRPFPTCGAAKTAAQAGDLIWVRRGTYDEKNLLKHDVNWHFDAGARVVWTGATQGGIWDDSSTGANGAVTSRVTGRGVFSYRTTTAESVTFASPYSAVRITNASSDVVIEGDSLAANWEGVVFCFVAAVRQSAGRLSLNFIDYTCTGTSATVYGFLWTGGELSAHGRRLTSRGVAIATFPSPATNANARFRFDMIGDLTLNTGDSLQFAAESSGSGACPNARVWVDAPDMWVDGLQHTAGQVYIQKTSRLAFKTGVANPFLVTGPDTPELWLDAQTLRYGATLNPPFGYSPGVLFAPENGGRVIANIGEIETGDTGTALREAVVSISGNVVLSVDRLVAGAEHQAGLLLGTLATFKGRIDASSAFSGNPVRLSDSGGTLRDVDLIASGGMSIVDAASPQSVNAYGLSGNELVGGNVTLVAPTTVFP